MKTFKEYLTESKKSYNFKIKVAGNLPESFQENLKSVLERCKVSKLEKLSTTPIQASPLDFPAMENCEVHVFEVMCEYPITSPEIAVDIKSLGIDESAFRVRGSGEPGEVEAVIKDEILNPDGLLNDSTYKEGGKINHKEYFGNDFNKAFLKDLEKTAKQRKKDNTGPNEYKLPKAKTDKAGLKSAMGSK
jgi:hypothetical protein